MAHAVRYWTVALSFALLSTTIALAQNPSTDRVSDVYVGTSKGVYLYHAGASGGLSLVSGSPFAIGGTAIGSNRSYFFSQGLDNLHVYPVAANGAAACAKCCLTSTAAVAPSTGPSAKPSSPQGRISRRKMRWSPLTTTANPSRQCMEDRRG